MQQYDPNNFPIFRLGNTDYKITDIIYLATQDYYSHHGIKFRENRSFVFNFSIATEQEINAILSSEANAHIAQTGIAGNIMTIINIILTKFLRAIWDEAPLCTCEYLHHGFLYNGKNYINKILSIINSPIHVKFVTTVINDFLPNYTVDNYRDFLNKLNSCFYNYKIVKVDRNNDNNKLAFVYPYLKPKPEIIWITDRLDLYNNPIYLPFINQLNHLGAMGKIDYIDIGSIEKIVKLHTLVHEYSHMLLGTKDHAYALDVFKLSDDNKIKNAENFGYVASFLYLYSCVALNGKPQYIHDFLNQYNNIIYLLPTTGPITL